MNKNAKGRLQFHFRIVVTSEEGYKKCNKLINKCCVYICMIHMTCSKYSQKLKQVKSSGTYLSETMLSSIHFYIFEKVHHKNKKGKMQMIGSGNSLVALPRKLILLTMENDFPTKPR